MGNPIYIEHSPTPSRSNATSLLSDNPQQTPMLTDRSYIRNIPRYFDDGDFNVETQRERIAHFQIPRQEQEQDHVHYDNYNEDEDESEDFGSVYERDVEGRRRVREEEEEIRQLVIRRSRRERRDGEERREGSGNISSFQARNFIENPLLSLPPLHRQERISPERILNILNQERNSSHFGISNESRIDHSARALALRSTYIPSASSGITHLFPLFSTSTLTQSPQPQQSNHAMSQVSDITSASPLIPSQTSPSSSSSSPSLSSNVSTGRPLAASAFYRWQLLR